MGKQSTSNKEPQSFEEMAAEPSFDPAEDAISSMTASFFFPSLKKKNIIKFADINQPCHRCNLWHGLNMAILTASTPGTIQGKCCTNF
jgi:hypothetical protein